MDLVLGVALTSRASRWVLVDGNTGEGDSIERGAIDLVDDVDPGDLLDVMLAEALVDPAANRIHAIGVTWTIEPRQPRPG